MARPAFPFPLKGGVPLRENLWAEGQTDIGTVLVVGSRARTTHPADGWTDLDLVVTVIEPERYLSETEWLEHIGNPCITFVERTGTANECFNYQQ